MSLSLYVKLKVSSVLSFFSTSNILHFLWNSKPAAQHYKVNHQILGEGSTDEQICRPFPKS